MGIPEILQESLIKANNEHHKWHNIVQGLDGRIVDLKVAGQRAQSQKDSATSTHESLRTKYFELLTYRNGLADDDARIALDPDLEERVGEVNRMLRRVGETEESVRQWRKKITEAEAERAEASANLARATKRWEQIRLQIGNVSQNL